MPDDLVIVKTLTGYTRQRTVLVLGEVKSPGRYGLEKSGDRISDVLKRVGGFKASADSTSITIRRSVKSNLTVEEKERLFQRILNISIDSLSQDPRLKAIAVRYVGAKSGPEQTAAKAMTDTSLQIGMPFGFDNNGIVAEATKRGLASFYDFSQVDRTRFGKNTASMFFVTFSQTSLLVAEAIQRGWASGAAATYFRDGIKANLEECAAHDAGSTIATTDITKTDMIAGRMPQLRTAKVMMRVLVK